MILYNQIDILINSIILKRKIYKKKKREERSQHSFFSHENAKGCSLTSLSLLHNSSFISCKSYASMELTYKICILPSVATCTAFNRPLSCTSFSVGICHHYIWQSFKSYWVFPPVEFAVARCQFGYRTLRD